MVRIVRHRFPVPGDYQGFDIGLMRTTVYKSLDRSVQFFGIKGRFLIPMVLCTVASLVISFIVAGLTIGLIGLLVFFVLFFSCALFIIALQGGISEKEFFTKFAMIRCPKCIRVKPQRLRRLWK